MISPLFCEFVAQWFLVLFFVVELTAKVVVNHEHQLNIVEDHEVYDEISENQRGTALSVASLVFAGITLVLADDPSQFIQQIEVLVASFGFLLIAAFAHELTSTYRVVLTVQEMALEYGLLMLGFGLYLLIRALVSGAELVGFIVFTLIMILRYVSVYGEIKAHYNES